ncbi:FxDxF family PEP-CTERM protein [Sphingomonas endophytica]|uniref:Ice-binding protein C-terminal domain-containing protein n=1 Tax=Sphingomonas endophytica TaxID=869719 RepID=A0A147I396_9SPHN|nr:FxDxF family PEP-CTERM protein [Sphingomonas endophytica]KTT72471.1 hypothetical protein NS334_09000 [Sphingomonas endophytica]
MKKIFAAALVAGTMTMASPAMAAALNLCTSAAPCTISMNGTADIQSGIFGNTFTGDVNTYSDYYSFAVPSSGVLAGQVSTISVTLAAGIKLLGLSINGGPDATPVYNSADNTYKASIPMTQSGANPQSLRVTYGVVQTGSYVGNVSWTRNAVPEPATWALMILGFGVVGYAMRRRPSVRIAQAI